MAAGAPAGKAQGWGEMEATCPISQSSGSSLVSTLECKPRVARAPEFLERSRKLGFLHKIIPFCNLDD